MIDLMLARTINLESMLKCEADSSQQLEGKILTFEVAPVAPPLETFRVSRNACVSTFQVTVR